MKQYCLKFHSPGQWLWFLTQVSLCYVFVNFRRLKYACAVHDVVCSPNHTQYANKMAVPSKVTTWNGLANRSDNDENKHDKVTFQLAAVDLNSSTLMVRKFCDRHRILKDNSWMCILHQYHKVSRLKASITMCQK